MVNPRDIAQERRRRSAASISVWQHIKLSDRICPQDNLACCWDIPTNNNNLVYWLFQETVSLTWTWARWTRRCFTCWHGSGCSSSSLHHHHRCLRPLRLPHQAVLGRKACSTASWPQVSGLCSAQVFTQVHGKGVEYACGLRKKCVCMCVCESAVGFIWEVLACPLFCLANSFVCWGFFVCLGEGGDIVFVLFGC